MSFKALYDAVQQHHVENSRVSTKWLTDRAIELSTITKVREQWTSVLDPVNMRGLYIEGPMGPPVPLKKHESLIVLSRIMVNGPDGVYWRRFVYTKELMHVFDTEEEIADTAEKLDVQVERLANPNADPSPQHRAELKAQWRAMALLCPEKHRLAYKAELEAGETSLAVVAAHLHVPVNVVHNLFRADFEEILKTLY